MLSGSAYWRPACNEKRAGIMAVGFWRMRYAVTPTRRYADTPTRSPPADFPPDAV